MDSNYKTTTEIKIDSMVDLPLRKVTFYPICEGNPMENEFTFTGDYIETNDDRIIVYARDNSFSTRYYAIAIIYVDKIVGYYIWR